MNIEEIKKLLETINEVKIIETLDNSLKHKGHIGVLDTEAKLTHIEITLSNKSNLSRLAVHRLIYQKLDKYILEGLHSIEIKILK